jgi:hypothetical protein
MVGAGGCRLVLMGGVHCVFAMGRFFHSRCAGAELQRPACSVKHASATLAGRKAYGMGTGVHL